MHIVLVIPGYILVIHVPSFQLPYKTTDSALCTNDIDRHRDFNSIDTTIQSNGLFSSGLLTKEYSNFIKIGIFLNSSSQTGDCLARAVNEYENCLIPSCPSFKIESCSSEQMNLISFLIFQASSIITLSEVRGDWTTEELRDL